MLNQSDVLENELKVVTERLKSTENKLDSVINLVYKTFTGDGAAAYELSNIVGVPPPILYCDDEKPVDKAMTSNASQGASQSAYQETKNKFNNRLEFLNQVMSDHDKMMINNYAKPTANNRISSAGRHNRARSADRMSRKSDRMYFNPYTWNLNEHMNTNHDSMYKYTSPILVPSGASKPLINKPMKSRPETRQNNKNNTTDVKVEDFFHHPSNRRSLKSSPGVKPVPMYNDFKLMADNETNILKPPKAVRPTSSLSYSRISSAKAKSKNKISSPYHNLNLQPMSDTDNNAEELLKAMEKRFELSTIDLQRRLGISQAGMVGP